MWSFIVFRPHNLLCMGRKFMISVAFVSKFCQISILNLLHLLSLLTQTVVTYSHACSYLLTCSSLLPNVSSARYMRTIDVISEVNCILLRSKRRFEFIALYPNFWRYIRTVSRFTNEEAGVQKSALLFVPAGFIRTFDVISEVNCVLLQRKQRFELFLRR